jgi:hypothetical protein
MQIDFHHAVTYVVARIAGFSDYDAQTVAYACQYVDDATNAGEVSFESGERYIRVSSAHRTIDIKKNSDVADNRRVWVPFHFLPGNTTLPRGNASEQFVSRMVCRPGSDIAYAMMKRCVEEQNKTFALERLGIALHTFVDTWAHQGFVGFVDDFNKVKEIRLTPDPSYAKNAQIISMFNDASGLKEKFELWATNLLSVGHAAVQCYPDMPFLHWEYTRHNGDVVRRDNPTDFLAAADGMYSIMRQFKAKNTDLPRTQIPDADRKIIDRLLRTTLFEEGTKRHNVWLQEIAKGTFSFGKANISYIDKGQGSWKFDALGTEHFFDVGDEVYPYKDTFLSSHWKKFHDALQYHANYVLHELLAGVSLCAS